MSAVWTITYCPGKYQPPASGYATVKGARGVCSVCGKDYALRADLTVRSHHSWMEVEREDV